MKRRKKRRLGASFLACLLVLSLILSTYGAKETVRADETSTAVELSADNNGDNTGKSEKETEQNNQKTDQGEGSEEQTGGKENVSDETGMQDKDNSESGTSEEDSSTEEGGSTEEDSSTEENSSTKEDSGETTGEETESTETSEEGSSTEVETDDEQTTASTETTGTDTDTSSETTASTETASAMTKARAAIVEEEEGFNPEEGGTLTAESGNATISAEVPAGAFDEVVEMKVSVSTLEAGSDDATLEAVRSSIEEDYDIFEGTLCSGAYVADISFENENGDKVQPKEAVDITVTPAAAVDVDVTENTSGIYTGAVYHIDDSSQAERIIGNVELNGNHQITSMVFSSDSFSPFAAVVMNASNEKVISTNQSGKTFNVADGQVLMIEGSDNAENPIVIENCTFNLSGKTVRLSGAKKTDEGKNISYNNGETVTKLFIGRNVTFNNCTFMGKSGSKSTSAGYDACVYFFSGDITLNNCNVTAQGWNGQFLGLYGSSGSVTFNSSNIATTGNKNGWSYAMYSGSVLKLNKSTMSAKGMTTDSGNINAFYSGDNRTGYDAIYFTESTVDFSDNKAGGFAINNVNIHVDDSDIIVNNNLGNACNSGYWIVTDSSSITMNGNREGHGLSCIGIEMKDSSLEVLHNGYAGVYIQSRDSSFTNSNINLRCNGERLLSYSAGDLWLQGHNVTFNNCESVWLGGVGRTGSAVNNGCDSFVAFDLNELNGVKSNTSPVLTGQIDAQEEHTLFLNPDVYATYESDYARGSNDALDSNDMDLMVQVGKEKVTSKDTARIGTLTTAQLSHHEYDWEAGEITDDATENAFGVERYACTKV